MQDIEKRYCQSCGMPLRLGADHLLGTNADQSKNDEFCFYCLKDGMYTVDYSMQQMVDVWVKYTDKYNGYTSANYSAEQLRTLLSRRLPTLSRWKQREETENVHTEAINMILSYINRHLFDELSSEKLSGIAGMSLFHFRRVFRHIIGENIGSYIQRLRLEYIAYQLISSDKSIKEILYSTSFQNKHSLSKAFRNYFGLSPSEYRFANRFPESEDSLGSDNVLQPTFITIDEMQVLCLQIGDSYKSAGKYGVNWFELMQYVGDNELNNGKYVSISLDEPIITDREQCRFYIGITVEELIKPAGRFQLQEIPEGFYAVFRFKGNYDSLHTLYRNIYLNWLPENGYRQREPITFEVYVNTPRQVSGAELITDVYIPVEKK